MGTLHEDHYMFMIISYFFLEREMFQTEVVEKIKHTLCSVVLV